MRHLSAVFIFMWMSLVALHGAPPPRVLCSTFPVYLVVRNITQGRDGISVGLLLPADLGCPHDYALTPQDMQLLQRADVLVINGLGLEEFVGKPLERANPKIKVIDASENIGELIKGCSHHHDDDDGDDDHDHEHVVNAHMFSSPRMLAAMAGNIARRLSRLDSEGADMYRENAARFASGLLALNEEFFKLRDQLSNNRIITQHGVFDYLARDAGLEIVAVIQAHAGQEPSASEMLDLVKLIRDRKPGAIFTEPQYPAKIAGTLSRETGIALAVLDPVATGPKDPPLDYYQLVMRKNLETLKKVLGKQQPGM